MPATSPSKAKNSLQIVRFFVCSFLVLLREEKLCYYKKRRFQGDIISLFQYLKEAYKIDGQRLSISVFIDKWEWLQTNKPKESRLRLDNRKEVFTVRMVRHLAQGCGCPIPVYGREVGTRLSLRSFQDKPFYDFIKLKHNHDENEWNPVISDSGKKKLQNASSLWIKFRFGRSLPSKNAV